MNLFAAALALQMFFPVFDNGIDNFASLALTNVSNTDAEFTVRLNSPDGQETKVVRIPVEAGQQRIVGSESLRPNAATPLEGWIAVEATTDRFTAYLVSGTLDALAAAEPALRPAVTSYLPHIRVRTGFAETGSSDTQIAVINPSQQPASATIRLMSYDKSVAQTVFAGIPAQGSRIFRASDLLPPGTVRFEGRATVQSFQPVAVWEKVETPVSWTVLRARSEADFGLDTKMVAPHFVFGGNYQSSLTIWNPTEPPITLEAVAYDSSGTQLGERVQMTLAPGDAVSSAIDAFFRIPVIATVPPPVITGSIRLREVNNRPFRVLANIETRGFDSTDKALMLHWLTSSSAHAWEIPFVAQNERFFTGYSITAVDESAVTRVEVSIEVHDLNGALVQRIDRSLPPRGVEAGVISPGIPGAYIRVWATQPISVVGSAGTHNGSMFEAVTPSR